MWKVQNYKNISKDLIMSINTTINRLHMNVISVNPWSMKYETSPETEYLHWFLSRLEPIQIIADCQLINEDTLVGLELQAITPFQFHFPKLWINYSFRQLLSPSSAFDLNLILNLNQSNVRCLLSLYWSSSQSIFSSISRISISVIFIWK